jgi:4-aminobutyrate aminotransferase
MHGDNPDPEGARAIQARALDRGLLLLTCGTYANVIRFLFPLTIQDEIFEEALGMFEASLAG